MIIKAKIGEVIHQVTVESMDEIIESLKKKLETITGIQYNLQKWIYQGKILNDQQKASDYNFKEDSCVIVIKSAGVQVSANPSPATASIPSPSPSPSIPQMQTSALPPIIVNTARFDTAMHALIENPLHIVEDALVLLIKVVNNIIGNPNEEKYRKLSSTNAVFSKKIQSVSGGVQCMSGLGFRLNGPDWILVPSAEAWEVLIRCKTKLELFLAKVIKFKESGGGSGQTSNTTTATTATATPTASSANATTGPPSSLSGDGAVGESELKVGGPTITSQTDSNQMDTTSTSPNPAITSDILAVLQAAAAIQVLEMEGQPQNTAGEQGGDGERKPSASDAP